MSFDKIKSVKEVQQLLGLVVDGIDGQKTWEAIIKSINPTQSTTTTNQSLSQLTPKAMNLILKYEVGGGEAYYNKALQSPTYPGGESGVTIGIGYDLGYNSTENFTNDWGSVLLPSTFKRLVICLGKKGPTAKALVAGVKDIVITWDQAKQVFEKSTIPRFIKETLKAFPGADQLHGDAFGALVSLVFNRGASVTGDSRREMLNIRNLIPTKDYAAIAQEIINMKRLWIGKGLDGLLKRRDEEAVLVKSCA